MHHLRSNQEYPLFIKLLNNNSLQNLPLYAFQIEQYASSDLCRNDRNVPSMCADTPIPLFTGDPAK